MLLMLHVCAGFAAFLLYFIAAFILFSFIRVYVGFKP